MLALRIRERLRAAWAKGFVVFKTIPWAFLRFYARMPRSWETRSIETTVRPGKPDATGMMGAHL
jgi:hypothetical protein